MEHAADRLHAGVELGEVGRVRLLPDEESLEGLHAPKLAILSAHARIAPLPKVSHQRAPWQGQAKAASRLTRLAAPYCLLPTAY